MLFLEFPIWPCCRSDQGQCFQFQSVWSPELWTVLNFKMHRRSLLASEKSKSAVVASIAERPTPSKNQTASFSSRNSAFITRSNNPNNKKEVNKPKFAKGIRGGKPRETSASTENSTTSGGKFCHLNYYFYIYVCPSLRWCQHWWRPVPLLIPAVVSKVITDNSCLVCVKNKKICILRHF